MAELINFNKARKARARTEAEARAAQNRVKFGRSKTEKALARALKEKAEKNLDAGERER